MGIKDTKQAAGSVSKGTSPERHHPMPASEKAPQRRRSKSPIRVRAKTPAADTQDETRHTRLRSKCPRRARAKVSSGRQARDAQGQTYWQAMASERVRARTSGRRTGEAIFRSDKWEIKKDAGDKSHVNIM